MSTRSTILVPVVTLLLGACANTTTVLPVTSSKSEFEGAVYQGATVQIDTPSPGAELFRVFQQGATGFVSIDSVRSSVEEIAAKFCERKGMTFRSVQETSSRPPHIFGNFPRVELQFECIQPNAANMTDADRIQKLEKLKKLLDDGALTKAEFESEKSKLLTSTK